MTADGPVRTMAVWCPDWPVTAAGIDPDTPGAVLSKGRVAACSRAARSTGVRRGQRLRDAQRLCPDLVVHLRDIETEGRLFEPVVEAVTAITPWVEVLRPGLCAFSVRGPARYHGGEKPLRDAVRDAVTALGHACGAGVADGVFAAVLAARTRGEGVVVHPGRTPDFLAPFPVRILERPELADLLGRLGVHTLGAFAALPPGRVAQRFGAEGTAAHRLAGGLDARPPAPAPPATDLTVGASFEPPAERAETVVFQAKALAGQLHAGMAAKGLVCVRFAAEVTWSDGRVLRRLWRHDGALSELAVAERVLWQLTGAPEGAGRTRAGDGGPGTGSGGTRTGDSGTRTRSGGTRTEDGAGEGARGGPGDGLAGKAGASTWDGPGEMAREGSGESAGEDPSDGAGGVVALRLIPDHLVPDNGRQSALWGRADASSRVERAAARVQGMLGHHALVRAVLGGGRGPADGIVRVPMGDLPPPTPAEQGPWPGGVPDPAPSVVPPHPLPAAVLDADGAPVAVDGRAAVSAPPARLGIAGADPVDIDSWAGPWPCVERWWDPASRHRRARLQVTSGPRAYLLVIEDRQWQVEAVYD
ncbi:protein ImuB [Murinocardiopsis flavida]|uniref:Protein ImuB n=1 Tax=Murinocardiopsis flavida TaxID=645275 RepID=A0A2P8DKP5_9ACTN|nr:DNA polymerase Y family protein [Murinocardiopsis flavida]PSK97786.1 protein ImuB [Murinocardiopsis flavida]